MNGMVAGEQAVLERRYTRDNLCAIAHRALRREFLNAAAKLSPSEVIATPAFERQPEQPLYEVIFDQLQDMDFAEVARLMLQVARGEPITNEIRLSVNVLLMQIANRHADVHDAALADRMEG